MRPRRSRAHLDRPPELVCAPPLRRVDPALPQREPRLERAALRQRLLRSRPRVSYRARVLILAPGHANRAKAVSGIGVRLCTWISTIGAGNASLINSTRLNCPDQLGRPRQ